MGGEPAKCRYLHPSRLVLGENGTLIARRRSSGREIEKDRRKSKELEVGGRKHQHPPYGGIRGTPSAAVKDPIVRSFYSFSV